MARQTAMAKRKKNANIVSYVLVAIVIGLITLVVYIQSLSVKNKLGGYAEKEQTLDTEISKQQDRSEEIDEFEKYVQTKAYAGEQAQEKLGLVKDGEIIFRKEN